MNPHFVFNALNSIKRMILDADNEKASRYLSKFALMIRMTLNHSRDIFVTLGENIEYLEAYLQMEQLRFGFKYGIESSENLDNIEIPSMLLQPFVENAVKHGIAHKAIDGKVTILFIKQANDLVLTVTDNGNGFDTEKRKHGLGLALSDSRIALLNSIYKKNRFTLAIQSTVKGTKINIRLTGWL
jgi:LytS/YehU family sensor histidine kinase